MAAHAKPKDPSVRHPAHQPVAKAPAASPQFLEPEGHHRLEAAVLEVFSTVDFHKANIRAVAKKAGVSFGTIYKYYGSKEGLLFSMVDHLQGIENLKEKLRKVFWLQLDYYERNPQLGRIIFMTVPLTTWMNDETFVQEKLIGMFMEALAQGQAEGVLNPNVRARVLLDIMHGLVQRSFFMWVYRGQKESLAAQANQLFEMCWRAMTNPERDCLPPA